ncbi:MAG: carbohydrate ABC transporter permease, partial [Candidatus Puniceispirillaceae bacterium]
MTGKQRKTILNIVQITLILIAITVMLVPIFWIFLAAFKNHIDVFQLKLLFMPTLENFRLVFEPPYYLGR